jgi:hypothetical protein
MEEATEVRGSKWNTMEAARTWRLTDARAAQLPMGTANKGVKKRHFENQ